MIKNKIAQLVLKNWKELAVILCLAIVSIKTRMDFNALNRAYETSREEMTLQIESLRDILAQELRQREEALDSYRDAIEEIERNYLKSQEEVERERNRRTTEYTRQFSQDQEGLANEIIDAYGFELVE